MRRLLPVLVLLASPALADPFDARGYTLGCDEEACTIYAEGFVLLVSPGTTPPDLMDQLGQMDFLTAVDVSADLGALGDQTAEAALTALVPGADDLYQDTLRFIQGDWQPQGEETPFWVQIFGLQWTEMTPDGPGASFLISPGEACADGTVPGGIALSLYPIGGDPEASACWQLEYATDTEMDLRDFQGDQGQVVFLRLDN